MICTNPEIGAMITRYALGLVNDDERKQFEEHLLSCDLCFVDFHDFSPVADTLQKHREEFLEVLAPTKRGLETWHYGLGALLAGFKRLAAPIPLPIRVLAPALAIAGLLLFVLAPEWQYANLASIERYPSPSIFRSDQNRTEAEQLFQWGVVDYRDKKDSTASLFFKRSVQLAPTNAAAHFYLGVTLMLQNSLDLAIVHLEQAVALKDTAWEQSSRWYLGNAYLMKNKVELARAELQKIAAQEGEFAQPAEALLKKIDGVQALPWWRRYFQKPAMP